MVSLPYLFALSLGEHMAFLFIGEHFSLKYHLSEKINTREMKLFSSKDKAIDYVCWYHLGGGWDDLDYVLIEDLLKESSWNKKQIKEFFEKDSTLLEILSLIPRDVLLKNKKISFHIKEDIFEIDMDEELNQD